MASEPLDIAAAPAGPAPGQRTPDIGLNPDQHRAVEALSGPVLVLAGAGTGKTRVLTTRLANILAQRLAYPSQILAVTFTNKAAREMRDRVAVLVGGAVEGLWLGTFHAIGARLLRRHAELVGLRPDFTIIDVDDQLRLIKQLLEAADIDQKRCPPRMLAARFARWKDRGLGPDKVPAGEAEDLAFGRGGELYGAYQRRLSSLNACDFGDLLLHVLNILQGHPDVLERYQQRFRYILVDEYQDTNVVQYLLLRLLAQAHKNLCCVGDDDQSIYSWRGAEVQNILRFESDFPGATVIRLEQNYRSTPHILGAAAGLIAKNAGRLGKTLWTERNDGERVIVHGVWDGDEEARLVAGQIENLHQAGESFQQMAILVRASFQTRAFEERFITLGLPYRLIGGRKFYERAEIRDAIAYARVIAQPDDDLAFERIVNVPKRGLGAASVQTLYRTARGQGMPLYRAAGLLIETQELKPRARTSLAGLVESFRRWRSLVNGMAHTELMETVLDESGYTAMWQADKSADAPSRLENLKELIFAMEAFENLGGFLEHVSLVSDADAETAEDSINVMTLHGAKGLEFDTVFLPGWEDGLFPHQRALDEGGNAALEEERRLAYVGLTRAKVRAMITYAANRRVFDRWQNALPSRFIDDLPDEHVARDAEPGLNPGGLSAYAPPAYQHDGYPGGASGAGRRMRRLASAGPGPPPNDELHHVVSNDPEAGRFAVGARVFHVKFGYGRIATVEGNKLDVDFDKAGRKKVIDTFVEPV